MAASIFYAAMTWWSLSSGASPDPGKEPAPRNEESVTADPQDDNNPNYSAWSAFKPGAWVIQKLNNETCLRRLVEVTPESVTVERIPLREVPWWEGSSGFRETYAAKPDADALKNAPKPRSTKEGDETVSVKGKSLRCHWTESEWDAGSSSRAWTCREVPGGYVKSRWKTVEQTPKGPPAKNTHEDTVIDWGTEPNGAEVENPQYTAWKKFKPGAGVTLKVSGKLPGELARVQMPDEEQTWTLLELTEDRVVLEGPPTKGGRIFIPRRVPQLSQKSPSMKQKEGDENVTLEGRPFSCRWVQSARSWPNFTGTFSSTVWLADGIPGRLVQLKEELPQIPGKSTVKGIQTITLVKSKE